MADDAFEVRPGDELDTRALKRHLRAALALPDEPLVLRQFRGGSANLTYLVTVGSTEFVLRRPPRGTIAPGAHDMAREHRVLSRLAPVYRRAPHAYLFCDDTSIIGAPFVVLERRTGVVVRSAIPDELAQHPDVARRLDLDLIDAAADLHALDLATNDLDELGSADGFGARQLDGWLRRWERAARSPEHAMHGVAKRLRTRLPRPPRASVVHNDLKLDNCQFAPDDPDVVASVLDWDMGTVGDPLFDLGLLIVSMQTSPAWVLSDDEAIERYATRSGIDVAHVDWYLAFATWRTAVVLQQLHNRWLDGHTTDERYRRFGAHVDAYVRRAEDLLR